MLSQNIDNKEIIFVDDCSADDSCKKCLVFAEIDKETVEDKGQYLLWKKNNFLIIKLKENRGPSIARRVGLENATGEFFACADPDDLIDPGMYDELYLTAVEKNVDLVWEDYFSGKLNEEHLRVRQNYTEDAAEMINIMFYGKTNSGTWNKLFRRSFAAKYNINFEAECLIVCEDLLFMVNFMRHLPKICYHSGVHYHHIFYPTSLSHQSKNKQPYSHC